MPGVCQFHKNLLWFGTFPHHCLVNLFNVKAHFLQYNILVIFFPLNNFDFIISSVLFEWYSNWFDIGLLIFISLFSISSFPLLMLTFLLLLSRSTNLLNLLAFSCLLLLFWQHTILLTWMHYGLFSFAQAEMQLAPEWGSISSTAWGYHLKTRPTKFHCFPSSLFAACRRLYTVTLLV